MENQCKHSIRIDSLCAICGAEIPMDNLVPILHHSDRVFQTSDEAIKIQKKKNCNLFKNKKMILILDIDQTILHTTFNPTMCDFSFELFKAVFFVNLRPNLMCFLEKISKLFEIHIYTMGTREYADLICKFIDPDKKFFGDRIVSRSENFNIQKKSIQRITCISENVIILDDRADVWNYSENLVLIRPFWVRDKIDINDPSKMPLYYLDRLSYSDYNSDCYSNDLIYNTQSPNSTFNNKINDDELKNVYKILKRIHLKYFKSKKSVKKLLKLKFMKNIRIAANSKYFSIILFSGCVVDFENPNFVLEDDELAFKYKVKNVKIEWLYECIYKRRMISINDYLIGDYSVKDEYEKEIEEEFFK